MSTWQITAFLLAHSSGVQSLNHIEEFSGTAEEAQERLLQQTKTYTNDVSKEVRRRVFAYQHKTAYRVEVEGKWSTEEYLLELSELVFDSQLQ
ncbi:hypothetical protein ACFVRD_37280 [Streptomyces sp. NPDC057908]|uniref:hypothetical protein n=1 Tax=Streptomyces sp. NPDC057908 TaxID=3346276 RepID=UPI0036E7D818